MATDLSEFNRMDATGLGSQDQGEERGEGVLDQRRACDIVATGSANKEYRRGMGLDSASRRGKKMGR